MRRLVCKAWLAALLTIVAACGGRGDGPVVPRPAAYPRVEIPDSAYRRVDVGGLTLMVNSVADVRVTPVDGGAWVDISYPVFSSPRMYLTLTECGPGGLDGVMANRRERESLNLGGRRYELTELSTPGGWSCTMSVARGSMTTPVQILAHDDRRVLSGALMLSLPDSLASDPAVIAPAVEAVGRDMIVLLKGLDDE